MATAQSQSQLSLHSEIPALERKLNTSPNDSEATVNYLQLINLYNGIDNDSAIIYARQGLAWFKERKYKPGQARMVLALGDYDDTHGNSVSASEKVLYAISLFKAAGDNAGIADAYNIMGVIEAKKGDFDKCAYYFIEAEKIYSLSGNKKGLFATWMNLGLLYDNLNDSAKLFTYYGKADSISQYLPVSSNVIGLYNNLGASYFEHHDTAKGFNYISKALKMSDEAQYVVSHIVSLMSLGELMYEMGRKQEGKNYLIRALNLACQHNLPDQQAGIYINFVVLSHAADMDSSIYYLNKALALVQATGNKPRELEVYRTYVKAYEAHDHYKESNKYLKLAHSLSDSLFNVNKTKEIANIAAVYDLQVSNAKINELEELINKNKAQKKIITDIVAVLVVVCALLIYFFTVLYHYYRKTKRLNHNLEERKKELAALNNMKDKLFSVIGHDLRGPVANIPVIISIIHDEAALDEPYNSLLYSLKEQAEATVDTLDKLLLLGKSAIKGNASVFTSFDPKPYVSKNIDLLSLSAGNKTIVIEDRTPAGLSVYADTGHFDFIIRNLLANAIKFSFAGGKIEINAVAEPDTATILFSVQDYGVGINKEALAQMFKATVTSTYGTANEKGTGIGLMLCEEFATLDAGKIWVDSEEGKGSVFYLRLQMPITH